MAEPTLELVLTEIIKLNSKFDTLNTKAENFHSEMQEFKSEMREFKSEMGDFRKSTDSHFVQLSREMAGVAAALIHHGRRLDQHDRLLQGSKV
jgi:uncharacterized coiled-coil DUF342 family protein